MRLHFTHDQAVRYFNCQYRKHDVNTQFCLSCSPETHRACVNIELIMKGGEKYEAAQNALQAIEAAIPSRRGTTAQEKPCDAVQGRLLDLKKTV